MRHTTHPERIARNTQVRHTTHPERIAGLTQVRHTTHLERIAGHTQVRRTTLKSDTPYYYCISVQQIHDDTQKFTPFTGYLEMCYSVVLKYTCRYYCASALPHSNMSATIPTTSFIGDTPSVECIIGCCKR